MEFALILSGSGALAWWLSRYDGHVTADLHGPNLRRRIIRCTVTLILVAVGVGVSWVLFIPIAVILAIIWAGCLSELFAGAFHSLIDSADNREVDPRQLTRELDRLGSLVQHGQNAEAVALCAKLKESSEGSILALEALLFRIYDQMFSQENLQTSGSLGQALRLSEQGRLVEAEAWLIMLQKQDAENLAPAFILMRLYALKFRKPLKARKVLQDLARRPNLPPCFLDYARRRFGEWVAPNSNEETSLEGVESLLVDRQQVKSSQSSPDVRTNAASVPELLSAGHLGTAIEILEARVREQPQDFETWLELAEAYGVHCCNLDRAGKIVAKIETNPSFSPNQVREAKAKLQKWRLAKM